MNSFERIYNRLAGKPVDRAPNLNILMEFAAKFTGVNYDTYCLDYRYIADANITCNDRFGIDMLSTMSDPYRETFDFGADIQFPHDSLPVCGKRFLEKPGDLKRLKLFEPLNATRMPDRIRAVEYYKKETGGRYSILGWVEGAFAEAAVLRGLSEIMMDLYDEPGFVRDLLAVCCEQEIRCAREQARAGADFIGIGDAAASLISAGLYREFVLPFEQALVREIHAAGAKAKLHICGNITHLLDDVRETGSDTIDIDWMEDFGNAVRKLRKHTCVNGNFNPVGILLMGTPQPMKEAVWYCLRTGDERTFISAGCEVPKHTPHENLMAVNEALREYGR
jgi:uroporphyrinogen decarboxylase